MPQNKAQEYLQEYQKQACVKVKCIVSGTEAKTAKHTKNQKYMIWNEKKMQSEAAQDWHKRAN